ncbi:hypothetical protein LY78DRAFT_660498 [Colletotrichum sublineola]|nr:hypothetical protein LY78DRAFT_660498 [Colletotrichum sublineola]
MGNTFAHVDEMAPTVFVFCGDSKRLGLLSRGDLAQAILPSSNSSQAWRGTSRIGFSPGPIWYQLYQSIPHPPS